MQLLLCLLIACPFVSDAQFDARVDADDDGLRAQAFGGADCNDADPAVRGPTEYFRDGDGDGFGDPTAAGAQCPAAVGWVDNAQDCDDADAAVGAATSRYPDADGDGYAADDAVGAVSCDPGLTTALGDCDDADAKVSPGAPENCMDDVDSDCDGELAPPDCTAATFRWPIAGIEPATQGPAEFGTSLIGDLDVDGDGVGDLVAGSQYDGGAFAFSTVDVMAGEVASVRDAVLQLAAPLYPGFSFAAVDLTGDGVRDLITGSVGSDDNDASFNPAILWLELPRVGLVSTVDGELHSPVDNNFFGRSVAATLDPNGDPVVLVGAPSEPRLEGTVYNLTGGLPTGRVSVEGLAGAATLGPIRRYGSQDLGLGASTAWIRGPDGPLAAASSPDLEVAGGAGAVMIWNPGEAGTSLDLRTGAIAGWEGSDEGWLGYTLEVGDVDGSGFDDLLAGSPYGRGEAASMGTVYVFLDAAYQSGWGDAYDADLTLLGDDRASLNTYGYLGAGLAVAGDMNGDGYDDIASGSPSVRGLNNEDAAGAVYITPGGGLTGVEPVVDVSWARYGDRNLLYSGHSLSSMGDMDDDGLADIAVGMPGWTDPEGQTVGAFTFWLGADL